MKNGVPGTDLIIVSNSSGITRWAPLVIVFGVVGGFVMLSWYAYHAGIQSVKEEDLVVVEADKTPIKEKPTDPGGMQFPNQDKTVFETFSGNTKQPAKVERVLPVPEEPMAKSEDASEPTTWVNHDLKKPSGAEQMISKDLAKKPNDKSRMAATLTAPDEKPKDSAEDEQSTTYVAPKKPPVATKPVEVAESKPFTPEKATEKQVTTDASEDSEPPKKKAEKSLEKAKPAPAASGDAMVQLGAYRSEDEANANWEKMHLKQKELSDKTPLVVKADLGEKGIYYRLRVGGLSPANAKSLCSALSAKGQACILVSAK